MFQGKHVPRQTAFRFPSSLSGSSSTRFTTSMHLANVSDAQPGSNVVYIVHWSDIFSYIISDAPPYCGVSAKVNILSLLKLDLAIRRFTAYAQAI